jgi:hypothetical protein
MGTNPLPNNELCVDPCITLRHGEPMPTRVFALRHSTTLFTAGLVVVSLLVCAALIVMTTSLHRASARVASAMDSVRVAQEARLALLAHERTEDRAVRERLEGELLRRIDEIRTHVAESGDVQVGAETALSSYVAAAKAGRVSAELRESTHAALDARVRASTATSQRAREDAARVDRVANVVGVTTGGALLLLAALLVWWIRRSLRRSLEGDHSGRWSRSLCREEDHRSALRSNRCGEHSRPRLDLSRLPPSDRAAS